jgi:hypothetical protein
MKYLIGIIFIINSETHVEWRTIKIIVKVGGILM